MNQSSRNSPEPISSISQTDTSLNNLATQRPDLPGLYFEDSPLMPAFIELRQSFEKVFANIGSTVCQKVTDENGYKYTRLAFKGDNLTFDSLGGENAGEFFACINHFYPAPPEIHQNYHNHRAQFLSYIFSPDADPGQPIYRLHVGTSPNRSDAITLDLCSGQSYSMIDFSNLYHEVEALAPLYTVLIAEIPSAGARPTNVEKELYKSIDGINEHARIHNVVRTHFNLDVREARILDL